MLSDEICSPVEHLRVLVSAESEGVGTDAFLRSHPAREPANHWPLCCPLASQTGLGLGWDQPQRQDSPGLEDTGSCVADAGHPLRNADQIHRPERRKVPGLWLWLDWLNAGSSDLANEVRTPY